MKNVKFILIFVAVFLINGCGGGGGATEEESATSTTPISTIPVSTTPTLPPTTSTIDFRASLSDWRKPRIYAVTKNSQDEDKIFSLMPHQNSIEVKFVDFTSSIDPNSYTLKAVHTQNENIQFDLSYDANRKKWIKQNVEVSYADKTDIYPTYWVKAINDTNGSVVAQDRIVIYDGKTDNCMACHASNSGYTMAYADNPANLSDPEEDFKTNILRVHDANYPDAVSNTQTALQVKGITYYDNAGLEATAKKQKISCTDCHGINGVQGSGLKDVTSLTNAIHKVHANLSEPNIAGAKNCLTCHGGETITKTFNGKIIHPLNSRSWRSEDRHGGWVEDRGAASCTLCHGPDLRGADIVGGVDSKKGSCYSCHGKEWDSFQIGSKSIITDSQK